MTLSDSQVAYLEVASAAFLCNYFKAKETSKEDALASLTWLNANRPLVADEVLCRFFNVAVLPALPPDEDGSFDESMHQDWVVATPAELEFVNVSVPRSRSAEGARSAAVRVLDLESKLERILEAAR